MAAQQQDKTPTTVADIAAGLIAQPAPAEESKELELPLDEGNTEVLDTEAAAELEKEPAEEVTLDEGNDDEDDAGEAGDDDAELGADEFDIRDDDILEVKIDGEYQQRSIADAKKALSGEGAIDKRLKDATEERKAAQAERSVQVEKFSQDNQTLIDTMSQIHGVVFKPQVAKPNPQLRQSNPQAYLQQEDAYKADQLRVSEGTQQLQQLVQQRQEAQQASMNAYRSQEAAALMKALPALADPETAKVLLPKMAQFAMDNYGYTTEEIQNASDHRMYKMMHDLMKMNDARDPLKRKASTVKNLEGQEKKRPRMLRSGGGARKTAARAQTEQAARTAKVARQTGKVTDVAQTLIK